MMPIGREAAVSGPSKRTARAAIRLLGEAVRLDCHPAVLAPRPYDVPAAVACPYDVPAAVACPAALAITLVAGPDAALVAAISHGESRHQHGAVNATTGACGPGQVVRPRLAGRRVACAAVGRDAWLGYAVAVERLGAWRAACAERGTPGELCSLAGYRGGWSAVEARRYRGARAVLRRAAGIRVRAGGHSWS